MLRKCKGKYYKYNKDIGRYIPISFELGYFNAWGIDYEEVQNGTGNYSIALIELPSGKVVKVNPSDLQFLDTKEYCECELIIPDKELTEEEIKNLIKNSKGVIIPCQN